MSQETNGGPRYEIKDSGNEVIVSINGAYFDFVADGTSGDRFAIAAIRQQQADIAGLRAERSRLSLLLEESAANENDINEELSELRAELAECQTLVAQKTNDAAFLANELRIAVNRAENAERALSNYTPRDGVAMKEPLSRKRAMDILREYPDADLSAFDVDGDVEMMALNAVVDVVAACEARANKQEAPE